MLKSFAKAFATAVVILFIVGPFYLMFIDSFQPLQELFGKTFHFVPRKFTLASYAKLMVGTDFYLYARNSVITSISASVIALIISVFTSYALVKFRFRGRRALSISLILTQMIPMVTVVLPLYVLLKTLGLVDTHLGLIIVFCGFGVPYCTLILRGFLATVPVEVEEAATIDGCTQLGAFIRVTLPLSGMFYRTTPEEVEMNL